MTLDTSLSYSIIKDLELKNRNFCSTDYDDCLQYLSNLLPFKIFSYKTPYNHWQIPPKWDLIRAEIWFKGECLYTVDHPLKIIGLSRSFTGTLSKKELQSHLFYDHRDPNAIPYHFRQFYRPWERDWGFCVPQLFYDNLNEGDYEVIIEIEEGPGTLKVAEYTCEGMYPECYSFVAHLDHPGMANDDLAGVAVGVELFKRLSLLKTKFSYKLILLPEIIGSEFYLSHSVKDKNLHLSALFLEMLGSNTEFALQSSLGEKSMIEKGLETSLKKNSIPFRKGPFRSIICNDEPVWESHKVSMSSLSRFPYKEYHSSLDNLSIIDPQSLDQSVEILYETILFLEQLTLVEKKFSGTPCVSHPELNLYVDPGQRAFASMEAQNIQRKRALMDLIPCQDQKFYLEDLIEKTKLEFDEAYFYLKLWEKKGLLEVK